MKLRLPSALRTALVAVVTAAFPLATTVATGTILMSAFTQQTQARDYATNVTVVGTGEDAVTYNGAIFTMAQGDTTFHSQTFTLYEAYGNYAAGSSFTSSGDSMETPYGNGIFWTLFCAAEGLTSPLNTGVTLRLSTGTTQQNVENQFSNFCIGGLIAEESTMTDASATNPAYWLHRADTMVINGTNAVNMTIKDFTRFSYKKEIAIKQGGTWDIASGKALIFDNNSSDNANTTIKLYSGKEVTVKGGGTLQIGSRNKANTATVGLNPFEMQANATLNVTDNSHVYLVTTGAVTTRGGSQINIDFGSDMTVNGNWTSSGTISNSGTIKLGLASSANSAMTLALNAGSSTSLGGAWEVGSNVKISAAAATTFTGTVGNVSGTTGGLTLTSGDFTFNGDVTVSSLTLNSGATATITPGRLQAGTVTVNNGGSLKLGSGLAGLVKQNITGAGTVRLGLDSTAWQTVRIKSDFSGAVHVDAGWLLLDSNNNIGTASWRLSDGARVRVADGYTSSADMELGTSDRGTEFFVNAGETGTISGAVSTLAGTTGSLDKTGKGTLVLEGNVSTALTVSEGTLELGSGSVVTLSQTITNNASLVINGTISVDSLSVLDRQEGRSFMDRLSPDSGNGYEIAVYSVSSGSGTVTAGSSATLTCQNVSYEIDGSGKVRMGESNGRYFVNTGTVVYGGADSVVAGDTTKSIVLNGGTLVLSQALSETHRANLSITKSSTLSIGEGVEFGLFPVEEEGVTLTLSGSGVYDIGNRQTLNDHVTLGSNWTGYVSFSGEYGKVDISGLVRTGSGIRFAGVSGWLPNGSSGTGTSTINVAVDLVDNGDTPALNINAMSSSFNYGFSNKVTGNGTLMFSGAGASNNAFNISGNIAGWTGKLEEAGTAARSIKFSGSATTINAAVEHTGSAAFTVKVENDNEVTVNSTITNADGAAALTLQTLGTGTKNFKNTVDVTTLTSTGGTATFEGTLKAGTLNVGTAAAGSTAAVNGAVTIAASGNATLTTLNVNAGTLTLNGTTLVTGTTTVSGTLALGDNAVTTFNDLTANSGCSITIGSNNTLTLNGTFNMGASGLTINAGTTLITGAGFAKTGSGMLTLANGVLLNSTGFAIQQGTVKINTGTGAEAPLNLGSVSMVGGTQLTQWSGAVEGNGYKHRIINMQSLTVTAGSGNNKIATLYGDQHNCHFVIGDLTLNGNTLKLNGDASSSAWANFEFTGTQKADDAESIVNVAGKRKAELSISGTNALRRSVLDLTNPRENNNTNVVAIAADNVNVLGLKSGNLWNLVSTASVTAGNAAYGVDTLDGDGVVRSITITGSATGDAAYNFAGSVGKNVNIVMDGSGTQKFSGTTSDMNGSITAKAGRLEFSNTVGAATAALTSVEVKTGGTLKLANGFTDTLSLAGTLELTGTLKVNNLLVLGTGYSLDMTGEGHQLTFGDNYVIDITGLAPVTEGGNSYRLFSETDAAKIGITTGENNSLDMSHIRTTGVGWSATYVDGLLTLTQAGNILHWNSQEKTATWTNAGTNFADGGSIGASASPHIVVDTSVGATLGDDITLGSIGVEEGVALTLIGGDYTLTVKDINLEASAQLDASQATISYASGASVDLSANSIFTTKAVTGQTYTGNGTLKVDLSGTAGAGTVSIASGSAFTGTVSVIGGTVNLNGSDISAGSWKLENNAGATIAEGATVAKDIVFSGADHNVETASGTATIAGNISGDTSEKGTAHGFTKTGAGTLKFAATTNLDSLTVSSGTLDLTDSVETVVGNLTIGTNGSLAYAANTKLTVNGTFTVAEGVTVGSLCTTNTDASAANSVTGINFSAGTNFVKAGAGTLAIKDTPALKNVRVEGGILQFVASGGNYGNVTLAGGNLSIGTLTSSAIAQQFDSVTLDGHDGSIETVVFQVTANFDALHLGGHTLTIDDRTTAAQSTYTFAGADAGSGKLVVKQHNARVVSVVLNGTETFAHAVLDIATEANKDKTILVAQDTVKMAGLSNSSATHSGTTYLISHGSTTNGVTSSEAVVRTLQFTGTGGTLTAVVGANLNLAMSGTGTETISGNLNSFNGSLSVSSGTLSLTNTESGGKLNTGNTVTLTGGTLKLGNDASFTTISGAAGAALSSTTDASHTLTLTGEGGTFAGSLGKFDITLASSATGTHAFTGTNTGAFGSLTVNAGTLQLGKTTDATVGSLTLASGAALTDSGTLDVTGTLAIASGSSVSNTNIKYSGASSVTISAAMENSGLEVAGAAGPVTLSGATKNLSGLVIGGVGTASGEDDILIDTLVTVSGHETIRLGNNAQIGFGNNRQLVYDGFTYTSDADDSTHGTISKASAGSAVTATNLRVRRTDESDAARTLDFTLQNVRFVNSAGTTTLTASGNVLSDIVVAGGKVILNQSTTITNDVNLAVRSAQLEVAYGKTLSNGIVTLQSNVENKALLIDNTTSNAYVFSSDGTAQIDGARVGIDNRVDGVAASKYSWGAQLTDSILTVDGKVELSNRDPHQLNSLTLGNAAELLIDGNITVGKDAVGEGSATAGDILMGCGSKLIMGNNGTLVNYVTIGESVATITVAGKDGANSEITNTDDENAHKFNVVSDGGEGSPLQISHSVVTVDTAGMEISTDVRLDHSTLEVIGGSGSGSVTAGVASGVSNDFVANAGDMTVVVDGGSNAEVGHLTMSNEGALGADEHVMEFKTTADTLADVVITGTAVESRIESGNAVKANSVTVAEGATLSVADYAVICGNDDETHTDGNLTVVRDGTLHLASEEAVAVGGMLTLQSAAVIQLDELAVGAGPVVFASAEAGITVEDGVLIKGEVVTSDTHIEVGVREKQQTFALMLSAGAQSQNRASELYATRVVNEVNGVEAAAESGFALLTTNLTQNDITNLLANGIHRLDFTVGEEFFASLRAVANADGTIDIQLAGLDLTDIDQVAFNGYLGTDGNGGYAVWSNVNGAFVGFAYDPQAIPEPATGALSVLALAALAARRRRKSSK